MKYILSLILIFVSIPFCYADRVCLEKSTGKLVEYQSENAPLGTLIQNAVNMGYKRGDVEEKYVTFEEWEEIKYEQIIKPAQEAMKQKEEKRKQKEEKIRQKLNLSEQDFQDLKEALRE